MGIVYVAEHLRLKRKVALEVLAPELAEDQLFRERFIHESELAVLTVPEVFTHIDPETGATEGTVPIARADGVAVGGGSVWVTSSASGTVSRVNPATDSVLKGIRIGPPATDRCRSPGGLAVTDTDVWVLSAEAGTAVRIDRQSERIVARIPIGGCPYAVAIDSSGVWVSRLALSTH